MNDVIKRRDYEEKTISLSNDMQSVNRYVASTMTVNATSQTIKPIYQNELNQAGRNSQTSRGINIDAYVSASLNGVTSNSSKAADNPYGSTPASTYVYSTVANAGDLIDVNSKDITLHANITNTNSSATVANVSLRLITTDSHLLQLTMLMIGQ